MDKLHISQVLVVLCGDAKAEVVALLQHSALKSRSMHSTAAPITTVPCCTEPKRTTIQCVITDRVWACANVPQLGCHPFLCQDGRGEAGLSL